MALGYKLDSKVGNKLVALYRSTLGEKLRTMLDTTLGSRLGVSLG